jgi:hypothetical protein
MVIPAILATDMSQHFTIVSQFDTVTKTRDLQRQDLEDRKMMLCMMLKSADISNVVKPFPIAKNWADILLSEFFVQGDMEKEKGLPVTPIMDRETVVQAQVRIVSLVLLFVVMASSMV